MKNLKELANEILDLVGVTDYEKSQISERVEKKLIEYFPEKLFDEKVMKFIEDKDVKQVMVSYKVYERFKGYSKLGVSEDLQDNEIIIEY